MVLPFHLWEQWDTERQGKQVSYSGGNYPPWVKAEAALFAAIVLPPAAIAETLGYRRTAYGDLASSISGLNRTGISNHYTPPPTIAAIEHLIVAVPFWLGAIAVLSELPIIIIRRRWQRAAAN
jgi:hypothetical protein